MLAPGSRRSCAGGIIMRARSCCSFAIGAMFCCTTAAAAGEEPLKIAGSQLEPITWTGLSGWPDDDHLAAFAAYEAGCKALRARTFFEENFQPVRIARVGEVEGLLTGYFEPIVQGSRLPNPEFHIPLYRRPRDLIAAGYRPGAAAFPNKGVRIGRRNAKGDLVPYYDRAAIEAGVLDGQKLEICWLRDMSDLTAIQTEGSGRIIRGWDAATRQL